MKLARNVEATSRPRYDFWRDVPNGLLVASAQRTYLPRAQPVANLPAAYTPPLSVNS